MPNRRDFLLSTTTMAATVLSTHVSAASSTLSDNHYQELQNGSLRATIGDNTSSGSHRAGYNGVWEQYHHSSPRSIFVPGIAGLNLEHLITGAELKSDDAFFEPRRAPMQLNSAQPNQVELYQPPTPLTHVESWTTFDTKTDHCLDMNFRCRLHRDLFPFGYIALFWASYIHAPQDKSMYFLGTLDGKTEQWLQLSTQVHNDQSTVRFRDDTFEMKFADDGRPALFKSLSPLRFTKPFFYGHIDDLIWCVMFDRAMGIRFTHSPSGGGFHQERQTSNPAWDFQFVIEQPELNRDYGFRARTLLLPRCSREDLLAHFASWQSHLGARKDI